MFNIFVKINNNIILNYLMEIHKKNNLDLLCFKCKIYYYKLFNGNT